MIDGTRFLPRSDVPVGSIGDLFPYYFHRAGPGKLIGARTWCRATGAAGDFRFIDGGSISVRRHAFYNTD